MLSSVFILLAWVILSDVPSNFKSFSEVPIVVRISPFPLVHQVTMGSCLSIGAYALSFHLAPFLYIPSSQPSYVILEGLVCGLYSSVLQSSDWYWVSTYCTTPRPNAWVPYSPHMHKRALFEARMGGAVCELDNSKSRGIEYFPKFLMWGYLL